MTCTGYREHLSCLLDNELDDATAARTYAHLAACDGCRSFLDSGLRVRAEIHAAPVPEVPARLNRRALQIPSAPSRPRSRTWVAIADLWNLRLPLPAPALAAAVLLVLLSVAFAISSLGPETPPPGPGAPTITYIMTTPIEVQGASSMTSATMN